MLVKCKPFIFGILFACLIPSIVKTESEYVKAAFKFKNDDDGKLFKGAELGASIGGAIGSLAGPVGTFFGVVIGIAAGAVDAAVQSDKRYESCLAKLKNCHPGKIICVLLEEEGDDECCSPNYETICYQNYNFVHTILSDRFPEYKLKYELYKNSEKMVPHVEGAFKIVDEQSKNREVKEGCNPERDCKQCGGLYSCIPIPEVWMTYSGCCGPGYEMKCCVTTTSTTTTTTTTTTTISTTTTTDEFLRCKKATFESNPAGNIYNEQEDKACSVAERHCYVLNCTTTSSAIEDYIGIKTEWGCSETKESFYKNFENGKGWLGKWRYAGSKCNFFVGEKYDDMSNLVYDIPIFNATLSTHWCKGGHFWVNHRGTNITVCKSHEHYCYASNCSVAFVGKTNSMDLEFSFFTKWGCADNKSNEDPFNNPKGLLDKNESVLVIEQICAHKFGASNLSMSNAELIVPVPAKSCKRAYLTKSLSFNESSEKTCGLSQRFCYVLNCSIFEENHVKIATEWGCADKEYDTDDFIKGNARDFGKDYIGPIPDSSLCVSTVVSGSNDDIIIPTPKTTKKCKTGRSSFGNKSSYGECFEGANACYFIGCNDSDYPSKKVKEWGCTSNLTQSCSQKLVELGFKSNECECHGGFAKTGK